MKDDANRKHFASQALNAIVVSRVEEVLTSADTALSKYFEGVRYLMPLRATAERYYRKQDLSISEIDPAGGNLAMYLDSLGEYSRRQFSEWVKDLLDFEISLKGDADQVMVLAQGKNDPVAFNVADMGVGISQVLPIVAQLWAANHGYSPTRDASIVVIEQPELHLHPDSQARLANVFAGAIKMPANSRSNTTPTILIETHSQHLVNRLGQLVEMGELSPDDVSIVLFEAADSKPPSTEVRVSRFSTKGVLQDWPYGFFDPEVY